MTSKDLEFRVGLIILIGIIILAVSVYWLRDYQLEKNSRTVSVIFEDVGTLEIGDKVNVSGVRKGKVKDIKLVENGVQVDLFISSDVTLRKDTRFTIKNLGVMGERFVAIQMGKDSVLTDESPMFHGAYDTGIPEVMGLMGEMIVELRSLVHSFKQTIGSDSALAKFNNTVTNLESVSASLDTYLNKNESKFDKTADNILQISKRLNNIVVKNEEKIDSTTERFARVTKNLDLFVQKLDTLAGSFREFADNINNPEGTLQLLTEDRRLYDDLRKTADNIDDLVLDIKANPRKYINLKVEIF
ncbi:MAG: MCE family protein [Calditrichaeota bacterium]|nr:MAG: MCE family protein [Calditrichota bacterium]